MTEERMLTLEDVAARLRVPFNERSIKRMIKRHKIAHVRAGRAWRLTEKQFAELVSALTCAPPTTYSQPVRRSVVKVVRGSSTDALVELAKERLQKPPRAAANGSSSRTRSRRKAGR